MMAERPEKNSSIKIQNSGHGWQPETRQTAVRGLAAYCFAADGLAPVSSGGVGACGALSAEGAMPRSSDAGAQSPAQSLVALTVPTSLQPIGASCLTCFSGLPPALGAPV